MIAEDSTTLFRRIAREYSRVTNPDEARAVFAEIESAWPSIEQRPPDLYDAETCRLGLVAAAWCGAIGRPHVYRARALALFTAVGRHEGVGMVLMGEALVQLAVDNDDYPHGRTLDVLVASDAAMEILGCAETLAKLPPSGDAPEPTFPTTKVLLRQVHEKRALFSLIAGDTDRARAEFALALDAAAGNTRGTIKVKLGSALVAYVAADADGRHEIAGETEDLAAQAAELGLLDLAAIGTENSVRMRAGRADLFTYDVL